MKSNTWFRLILFPLLFPLSVLYGLGALIHKKFSALNQVVLGPPVFSIGNFTVGGTGKTPIAMLLVETLEKRGLEPILISKSYKGSLKRPTEVEMDSDVKEVGDEPLLLKKSFPHLRVFSGPHKTKTALFAASKIVDSLKSVFVIDDGAQHHGFYKSFKIHIWDMSLHKIDAFPFPLGLAREFWFWGEKPELTVLNRSKSPESPSSVDVPKVLRAHYNVSRIVSTTGKSLEEDFTLISGLGNFEQLEASVDAFSVAQSFKRLRSLKGRDHDHFSWFQPEPQLNYVCTWKDYEKLKDKVKPDLLYVVESEFANSFKSDFARAVDHFFTRDADAD